MAIIKRPPSPVFVGCTEPKANCTIYELQATSYKLQRGKVRYLADSSLAAIRFTVPAMEWCSSLGLSAPYAVETGGRA